MINLRLAQLSDYSAITKLHTDNWRQNYRGIFSDAFLDNNLEDRRSKIWYNKLKFPGRNQKVTVAISDDIIVGFYCLSLNDNPVFGSLLDNLHVSAGIQKSGMGKLLMIDCAKTIIDNAGSRKLYLWVYAANLNAISFYDHLGGKNTEVVEKQNEDGTKALAYRYVWDDVSTLNKAEPD
jgi:hypothetical protein